MPTLTSPLTSRRSWRKSYLREWIRLDDEIKPVLMMPDNLHPIQAGYEIWLDELCPVVDRLLER